jgi:GDPmannose 4,6-dehydratase
MQWLMLQQPEPDDYVIATGHQYSVKEFIQVASQEIGMELTWEGLGEETKAYDHSGKCIVSVDPRYYRPTEVETLLGDPTKAKEKLGWQPQVPFTELVAEMMREDLKAAERDSLVQKHGYPAYNYHE